MAQNNVFQMLAQQELDRPQRRLSKLQTQMAEMQMKKATEEQAYQDRFKTAMNSGGQPLSLSSIGDPTSAVNVPRSPEMPQQPTIVDQFKRQYDFHLQNGRADLAQQVMEHQVDLSSKAAKVAEQAFKTGGKEGLAAWLQANPTFAPLLGDPSHMQLTQDGVLFPASDEKGQPVPGMFWYRGADGSVQWKEIKPQVDQEALIDKRFANQQKLQSEQIAAQDRRTAQQIAAADRRAAKSGTRDTMQGGKPTGGKILPAGQLESIADMKRVKDVLAEASDLLKGGKVDTGPVSGRLQSLGAKVGLASDNFVNLQQKMQTAENIMLKLRSGAAVTESEYQRFKKEFPRTSDTPEVRDRKMSNAIQYASTLMDSKMDIYEEGGYRVPQSVKSGSRLVQKGNAQPKQGQTKKGGRFTIIEVK